MVTTAIINTHFRNKFHLFSLGTMNSYGPVVIIPAALCVMVNEFMTRKVLLQPDCRECVQVQSGVLQVATTVVYSGILAPAISLVLSKRYLTFTNPRHKFEPTLKYAYRMNASTLSWGAALVAANFALAAFIRYKQQQQLDHLIEREPVSMTRELLEVLRD